jgi:hypothetical protein
MPGEQNAIRKQLVASSLELRDGLQLLQGKTAPAWRRVIHTLA